MRSIFHGILITLLACTLLSCGKAPDSYELNDKEVRSKFRPRVKLGATSDERFQLLAGQTGMGPTAATASPAPFHWEAPAGWQELASTPFRMANFRVGPALDGECYLSVLPGGGGGLLANANRWRSQMGLPPYSAAEFADLDTRTVLGLDAVYVEFEGTYSGMGEGAEQPGYGFIGVLLDYEAQAIFVKMVGPASVVNDQRPAFQAFLDSLHPSAGGDHAAATTASTQALSGAASLPPGHPPIEGAAPGSTTAVSGASQGSGFQWTAPPAWTRAADRSMRLVTYTIGETAQTECYVTVLGGDGGGSLLNINRWLAQLGQPSLSNEEIEQLPTITVLGTQVALIEAKGSFTGMGGAAKPGFALLGVAHIDQGSSLFIKMTGPESEVSGQKENFIAFCESMQTD